MVLYEVLHNLFFPHPSLTSSSAILSFVYSTPALLDSLLPSWMSLLLPSSFCSNVAKFLLRTYIKQQSSPPSPHPPHTSCSFCSAFIFNIVMLYIYFVSFIFCSLPLGKKYKPREGKDFVIPRPKTVPNL